MAAENAYRATRPLRLPPLAVMPRYNPDKVVIKRDARLDVKDRRSLAADKVRRCHLLIGPIHHSHAWSSEPTRNVDASVEASAHAEKGAEFTD